MSEEGVKFENIIASHLLKFCQFLVDSQGLKANLWYLRDVEKREVDFLVTVDDKPWFCVEVKTSYKSIPNSLIYFKEKLQIPFTYLVIKEEDVDLLRNNIRIISASKFLTALV